MSRLTMAKIEPVFRLRTHITGCPSTYHFDAYCKYENPDHFFQEFPHTPSDVETYGEAVKSLRSDGWIIHRDGSATCPKCATRLASMPKGANNA